MRRNIRFATMLVGLVTLLVMTSSIVFAQGAAAADKIAKEIAKSPNPELIGQVSKELNLSPKQATAGVGALLGAAKTKMNPADFTKLSGAVQGVDKLLKAAPKMKGLDAAASAIPGASALGGLAPLAGALQPLGISPDMITKMVPIVSSFVGSKGGADLSSLFMNAIK